MRFAPLASLLVIAAPLAAQSVTIPLTSAEWVATDSIRFADFLGRPAVYINTGVALSQNARLRNGTIEFDMAAPDQATNLGVSLRAVDAYNSDVIFFRPGSSNTDDAMQYSPSINAIPTTWQLFHGPGANVSVPIDRNKWMHVKIRLFGDSAAVWLDHDSAAVLVIPRLAGPGGDRVGLWGSGFGRGAWFSNLVIDNDSRSYAKATVVAPRGTIGRWQISQAIDAATLVPGVIPPSATLKWDSLRTDVDGMLVINRLRKSPAKLPYGIADSAILANRVAGSQVVFARATITVASDTTMMLDAGYSDNAVIYLNGRPLFSGIGASGFHGLGYFEPLGAAVFLPLHKGTNELMFAVTEFFGGWALSARLREMGK